ncbi:hypothetical protein C5167_012697 [Papaver somniferum]|uniref:Uncharacterized protein n=1 Tax=Papaver somniferum TaxID=3469 RepID=A0A4Y7IZ17_PAPSO|nr:hypothetical protein C5167_012697 [Papaver somniferum]
MRAFFSVYAKSRKKIVDPTLNPIPCKSPRAALLALRSDHRAHLRSNSKWVSEENRFVLIIFFFFFNTEVVLVAVVSISSGKLEFDNSDRPECNHLLSVYQPVAGKTDEVGKLDIMSDSAYLDRVSVDGATKLLI